MYKLLISKKALKFITLFSQSERNLIKLKFSILIENPYSFHLDIKKLKGKKNLFRLRIGKYRFIYHIKDSELVILIMVAGKRGDIYK